MKRFIISALAFVAFASPALAADKIKIGLSFSDFATERWAGERDQMTKILTGMRLRRRLAGSEPRRQAPE